MLRSLLIVFPLLAGLSFAQSNANADEQSVRDVVQKFINPRNANDGKTAASAYSQHGEYINGDGTSRRGAALLETWNGGGPVPREIVSLEMMPPGIGWKIRLHELQTTLPRP